MRILITGGAGFIGSHLTKLHLEKKDEVIVIDNLITGQLENIQTLLDNYPKQLEFLQADIVSINFHKLKPVDIIYHLASPASPIQYKKHPLTTLLTNSYGTYRLLDWQKNGGATISVLASTSEIYGDPLIHPQTESYWGNVNPVGERACYDEAKRFAEALAMTYYRRYDLNIRIARIFNTYGPNMEKNDGRVISNFIVQALTNSPLTIYGDGKQTRSFCYVADLVEGLYKLATTKNLTGEIINLGNPDERSIQEVALLIKKLTKSLSNIVYQSIGFDDPKKRKPDISKAQRLLNWQPTTTLFEGLKKTISYFKKIKL